MRKMKNIKIDYRVLAKHFEDKFSNLRSATEAMKQLKEKHEAKKKSLWVIYVKAYNYDLSQEKDHENK